LHSIKKIIVRSYSVATVLAFMDLSFTNINFQNKVCFESYLF